ncbi:putative Disease resistance protein RPM1 [Corchorus capsularis]|uniref:Putative Disease resistance protein RPM1 n=1 Tax=Corchorus capsularis TaxID=210143 RepID=A0A1R3GTI2_COCAP|nr:putative Disease resistance protein RPM1 [Corchorus capsularis]
MAEVAVSIVMDKLIPLFNEKLEQLRALHREVEDIKVEFEFIASFLKEADARVYRADSNNNSGLKTWVKHVREAAFQIEDVVDEYMLHLVEHRDQHGCRAFLRRIARPLKNLRKRHEMVSRTSYLVKFVLNTAEKLYNVDMESKASANFASELGRLKQLRKLGIINLKPEDGEALCLAIEQMTYLQSLRISSINEDEYLQLESLSSPPPFLQSLRLHGRLSTLHDWISKLKNLVRVGLQWTRIPDDSFKILGVLPKLLYLYLYKGYDGDELQLEEGHFQQLKYLGLFALEGLNRLLIDKGALPLLEKFRIGPCPQLEEVPLGICYLKCLTTLEFWEMPREFSRKMLPDEGPDHWKVKHIPNVEFYYRSKGASYDHYKLSDSRLSDVLL